MEEKLFKTVILTPTGVKYRGETIFVELNSTDGWIGIYKNHVSLITFIKECKVKVTELGDIKEINIGEGLLCIKNNEVSILEM